MYHNLVVMYSDAPDTVSHYAVTRNMRNTLLMSASSPKTTRTVNRQASVCSFDQELDFGYNARHIRGTIVEKQKFPPRLLRSDPVVTPNAVLLVKVVKKPKSSLKTSTAYVGKPVTKLNVDVDWGKQAGIPVYKAVVHVTGFGFEKSPSDGGFDEVATRNCVLQLANDLASMQKAPPRYTTFLDADEFIIVSTAAATRVTNANADIVSYKTQQAMPLLELSKFLTTVSAQIHSSVRRSVSNASDRIAALIDDKSTAANHIVVDNVALPVTEFGTLRWLQMLSIIGGHQKLIIRQFNDSRLPTKEAGEYLLVPDATGHHPRTISNDLLSNGSVKFKLNPRAAQLPNNTKHCVLSAAAKTLTVLDAKAGFCGLHVHHPSDIVSAPYALPRKLEWINRRLFSKSVRKLLASVPSLDSLVGVSGVSAKLLRDNGLGYLSITH